MQQNETYKKLVSLLAEISDAEKIYLLGKTITESKTETIFPSPFSTSTSTSPSASILTSPSHLYLLILVPTTEERRLNSLQDKIENNAQHLIPVTAIVLSMDQFNAWLAGGHHFSIQVLQKALLIHDAGRIPVRPCTGDRIVEESADQVYKQTRVRIREFLAGAELYRIRVQYKLSAFMLHQAVEQALRSLLILNTGLRINTHNIDKLVRCCSMFCCELQELFPKKNERSKRLFQLLQKAYIDARYSEEYSIRYDELMALTEKIKSLEDIFGKWSENLGTIELGTVEQGI
jgi:HEPN domain-containing protein